MKSIESIYERYPAVKDKIKRPNDPNLSLSTEEAVFIQLVKFYENPTLHQFSLNMLYEHLKDEDLLFALESVITFFQKDTILVQDVSQTFYDSNLLNEQIVGQKNFSLMVEEAIKGMKFRPSMLYMYWKRRSDRVPRPDLIIDGTPYWKVSSVELFITNEKKRRKTKKKT
ncbi:MAG: hypothetical protein N2A99_06485 [Carnobacterium alterfunditum]